MENGDDIELHDLESIEEKLRSESSQDGQADDFLVFSASGFMVFSASGFMII